MRNWPYPWDLNNVPSRVIEVLELAEKEIELGYDSEGLRNYSHRETVYKENERTINELKPRLVETHREVKWVDEVFPRAHWYLVLTDVGKNFLEDYRELMAKKAEESEGEKETGGNTEPCGEEEKYTEENAPPEYREGGRPDGAVLTVSYLTREDNDKWAPLWPPGKKRAPNLFTRAYQEGKLTDRIKVGRAYAYQYKDLCALRSELCEKRDE